MLASFISFYFELIIEKVSSVTESHLMFRMRPTDRKCGENRPHSRDKRGQSVHQRSFKVCDNINNNLLVSSFHLKHNFGTGNTL